MNKKRTKIAKREREKMESFIKAIEKASSEYYSKVEGKNVTHTLLGEWQALKNLYPDDVRYFDEVCKTNIDFEMNLMYFMSEWRLGITQRYYFLFGKEGE